MQFDEKQFEIAQLDIVSTFPQCEHALLEDSYYTLLFWHVIPMTLIVILNNIIIFTSSSPLNFTF